MYTNRFFIALVIVVLVAVVVLTVQEAIATSAVTSSADLSLPPRPDIALVTGAEAWPYIMDSATRSYIAWGQAMQVRNALDSGTRSYIAWGEALEAAGKLGDSGACSSTTQENIFAGIPDNLDSATRSNIAWGLALQAKDDIRACR